VGERLVFADGWGLTTGRCRPFAKVRAETRIDFLSSYMDKMTGG